MAVKYSRTSSHCRWRAGVKLQMFLETLILKRLSHALGHVLQVDLIDPVPGAFQQPDLVLAEGQDVKVTVAGKQRQQRFQMEAVGNHHQFFKRQRNPVRVNRIWGEEQRQPIALVSPEAGLLRQRLGRLQHLTHVRGAKALFQQALLRLAQQVPEANRILFRCAPLPVRWHVQRDTPARMTREKDLQFLHCYEIHTGNFLSRLRYPDAGLHHSCAASPGIISRPHPRCRYVLQRIPGYR